VILSPIYEAIMNRLKADTGTGGLYEGNQWNLITGVYAVYGSPNPVTGPYMVFTVRMDKDPTCTSDEFNCTATMNIYAHTQEAVSDNYIGTTMLAAMNRIHGDSMMQANRSPTYGFNRFRLALPTNIYSANGGGCLCSSYNVEQIDEHTCVGTVEVVFKIMAPLTA